jgi:hypothetical protein
MTVNEERRGKRMNGHLIVTGEMLPLVDMAATATGTVTGTATSTDDMMRDGTMTADT